MGSVTFFSSCDVNVTDSTQVCAGVHCIALLRSDGKLTHCGLVDPSRLCPGGSVTTYAVLATLISSVAKLARGDVDKRCC